MIVTGPRGARVSCDYPHGLAGAAISRRDLDAALVDAAIAAGVEFMPAVRVRDGLNETGLRVTGVRLARRSERMAARVVIAADGRRSTLAFGFGLTRFADAPKRWAFGAYFSDVAGVTTRGEMHVRTDGYIGVAGLGGGVTNVCVVHEIAADRVPPDQVIARACRAIPNCAIVLPERDRYRRCRHWDRSRSRPVRPDVPDCCWRGMRPVLSIP